MKEKADFNQQIFVSFSYEIIFLSLNLKSSLYLRLVTDLKISTFFFRLLNGLKQICAFIDWDPDPHTINADQHHWLNMTTWLSRIKCNPTRGVEVDTSAPPPPMICKNLGGGACHCAPPPPTTPGIQ